MAGAPKRRWSDLPPTGRAGIAAVGAVQVALLGAALADLRRRPAREVNGSKAAWTALSFVNVLGPLAYSRFGRRR